MFIEQDYLATSQETLEAYFTFFLKYTQLNQSLRDLMQNCISKKYELSIDKALLLVFLHVRAPNDGCYIHYIISQHWYTGLNPSYILKNLSNLGLIEKKNYTEDKRKTLVKISSKGANIAQEIKNRMEYLLDKRLGLIQSLSHAVHVIERLIQVLP
ncbi:putative transcriptional regulator, MarR family [Holospora obtusa F1]|uniref:Transcriptional regulator, MarR family n=1 Tax=Holospora obtusa F1 TaxID=1399147 RepID=W6THQ9_HOLOB|nr:winged helix DNA-binding protein [Holospora obtusa]ETZ07480.1 putative transcriptional regulator, MarR family [Holospora obtusa F1]